MKSMLLFVLLALSSLIYSGEVLSDDFLGIRLGMNFAEADALMMAEAEKNGILFYRAGTESDGITSMVMYRGNYRLKDAEYTLVSVINETQQVYMLVVFFKNASNWEQLIRLFRSGLERRYKPTLFVKTERRVYRMETRGMRISVLAQGYRDVVVGAIHIRLNLAVEIVKELKKDNELDQW